MDNTITVKTDAATKKAAASLAKDAGLSLEVWAKACLVQAIVSRQLEVRQPTNISPELEKILEEARREVARGDFIGPFNDYKEAVEAVEALDQALEDGEPD